MNEIGVEGRRNEGEPRKAEIENEKRAGRSRWWWRTYRWERDPDDGCGERGRVSTPYRGCHHPI
jgi:hypothetical protein